YMPRWAASAAWARPVIYEKNAFDWPMNSPIAVRKLRAPMAAPAVFVGRTTEHGGRLALMNGQGSGMIRLVWNISFTAAPLAPVLGSTPLLRSGNVRLLVGSMSGRTLPAFSCHV